ncbi:regulatory particle non-ATPase [Cryptotrichosporon argae]
MSQLQSELAQVQEIYSQGSSTAPELTKRLKALKLQLAQSGLYFAPPDADQNDLLAARSVLEIATFNALRTHDFSSYAQYNSALYPFYSNLASILPASPNRPIVVGLQLLHLLSEGKYSQFHMTVEALDAAELNDVFIRWPVDLERWMMEGAYNKIYRARERVPREEYAVLLDKLMGTIREQIALTIETSYPSLPQQNAASLLFFKPGESSQLADFATKRGWELAPSTQMYTFPNSSIPDIALAAAASRDASRIHLDVIEGKGVRRGVPMQSMIKPSLDLAHHLEAIV